MLIAALALAGAASAQTAPPSDQPNLPPEAGSPAAAAPEPSGSSAGDPATAARLGSPSAVVSPSSPMQRDTFIPTQPYKRTYKSKPRPAAPDESNPPQTPASPH
jgi:hypothetical protein